MTWYEDAKSSATDCFSMCDSLPCDTAVEVVDPTSRSVSGSSVYKPDGHSPMSARG